VYTFFFISIVFLIILFSKKYKDGCVYFIYNNFLIFYNMSGLQFNNGSDFNKKHIETSQNNDNIVVLENKDRSDSGEGIVNRMPQLARDSEGAENRRVKIKPSLNAFDFKSFANPKKNTQSDDEAPDHPESDEEDIDLSDGHDDDEMESIRMPDFSNTSMDRNMSDVPQHDVDDDEYSNDDAESEMGEEVSSDDGMSEGSQMDEENDFEEVKKEKPKKSDNFPDSPPRDYRERTRLKQELMFNLIRLEKSGYEMSKRLTMASSYDDLLFEFRRLKKQRDVESSIKFARKILMLAVSGTEKLNKRFDPLDIKLDGWSENVMENINDYDEVFEELHEKYSGSVSMPPELKLALMVIGSGFMFHLSNSLFKTVDPDIRDLIRNNPEIAEKISKSAMDKMSEKMGVGADDPVMSTLRTGVNMKNQASQRNRNFNIPRPNRGQMPRPSSSSAEAESVDNILNNLERNHKPVQSKNINNGIRLNL